MATVPFGAALEAALKLDVQGGSLSVCKGPIKLPRFFCCISGTTVGVPKEPVAVLILDKTRACTNEMVTADVSRSWHPMTPAFSIQTYFLDWGDGQTSGPAACPGGVCPGAVGHPLGGYIAPGIYTVTLTVTDNQAPAATAEDTVQVEVIDCIGPLGLGAFGACGASGVWFTENGGLTWQDRSGELSGVVVYDLEVNPFSLGGVALLYDDAGNPYVQGNENIELWAATAAGLYRSKNGGGAWEEIDLNLAAGDAIATVLCSKYDPLEVYALVHNAAGTDVWLYRSVDGGTAWTNIQMVIPTGAVTQEYPAGAGTFSYIAPPWHSHKFTTHGGTVWFCGRDPPPPDHHVQYRVAPLNWPDVGDPLLLGHVNGITGGGTYLWMCGTCAPFDGVARWNGVTWDNYGTGNWTGTDIVTLQNGNVAVGYGIAGATCVDVRTQDGALVATYTLADDACGYSGPRLGVGPNGDLYMAVTHGWPCTNYVVFQHTGGDTWHQVWEGTPEPDNIVGANAGVYTALDGDNNLLRAGGIDPATCTDDIHYAQAVGNNLYVAAGTKIYRHGFDGYVEICDFGATHITRQIIYWDHNWYAIIDWAGNYRVYSCDVTDVLTLPADGRHHIMDMDGGGSYIYIAALDAAGNPVIMRVPYDLSIVDLLYQPGAGAWGGVKADYSLLGRVWAFGDFGASKVRRSNDYGDTWTDVTEAAWAGTDIVRPVLPSLYDSDDVFAVENIAAGIAQAWHSGDAGATWDGPHALDAAGILVHCAERDFVEPSSVFAGRVGAGANNLRFSPNNGASWANRNVGFPGNAPVTAIVVVA